LRSTPVIVAGRREHKQLLLLNVLGADHKQLLNVLGA
jgi:hypothetical protein